MAAETRPGVTVNQHVRPAGIQELVGGVAVVLRGQGGAMAAGAGVLLHATKGGVAQLAAALDLMMAGGGRARQEQLTVTLPFHGVEKGPHGKQRQDHGQQARQKGQVLPQK
jgi:hypothetical protein